MIEDKSVNNQVEKVEQMLKGMRSRGIKQRLRKRIVKQFGEVFTLQQEQKGKKNALAQKVNQAIDQFQNLKGVQDKKENKVNKKKNIRLEKQTIKEQPKKNITSTTNIEEEAEIKVIY